MPETKLDGEQSHAIFGDSASFAPTDSWYVTPSMVTRRYRRRWYLVAICIVVGAAGGLVIGRTQSKVYSSTATLFLASTQGSFMTVDSVNAYAQLPQTTRVLERAARQARVEESVPTLRGALTVTVPFNTDLVKLTMSYGTANGAAALAQAVAAQTAAYISVVSRPSTNGSPLVSAKNISPAAVPASPVRPDNKVDLGLGLIAGVLVSLLIAALPERRKGPALDA